MQCEKTINSLCLARYTADTDRILSPSDINECKSGAHKCHAGARCTNTVGSYTCQCNPGYHGDGRTCTGKLLINEGNTK